MKRTRDIKKELCALIAEYFSSVEWRKVGSTAHMAIGIKVYPEKKSVFESFMSAQLDGSYDLENGVIGVTWLLKAE